ncbi:hypothetical protein [Cognatishimia maritima]|uniref:Uncharacterized protein n=1 Tax=Cognatishimia maritima TaxID=870908 RepID=A0A1M5U497_9RHOB|nr:hypothetical protein [Cognatishimia maritima]SHH57768.1 hypothetical protein SAMN04488044_2788 [Cognatishimia maritima]
MAYGDTMGSLGRVIRPAVREYEQKEKDRQRRAIEKANAQDLSELEGYINQITGLHHQTIDQIDWKAQTKPDIVELYNQMRSGDDNALMKVIKSQHSLSRIHKLGRGLGFTVENGLVHAILALHNQSIVPDFHFKYMPSGKLAEVKMPREKRLNLYRAYASSAVLKVASDLVRLVPIGNVVVTAIAACDVADSEYEEDWPVLSSNLMRKTVLQMDMPNIDPVAAVGGFQTAERFHPIRGLRRIVPLLSIPARMSI